MSLNILFFFATTIAITLANPFNVDSLNNWKIVGGNTADRGQFPFIVSLRSDGSHMCGGSILNKEWVVTAAHCAEGQSPAYLSVVIGTNQLDDKTATTVGVSEIVINPNWDSYYIQNDIALLKLTTPLTLTDLVQTIQIEENYLDQNRDCTIIGWGRTSVSAPLANDLQYLNSDVVLMNTCKAMWSDVIAVIDSEICTLTKAGEGACYGDSGGPLVVENDGKFVLIGLVSFGSPCAKGMPDVFTRVASFSDWIKSIVNA